MCRYVANRGEQRGDHSVLYPAREAWIHRGWIYAYKDCNGHCQLDEMGIYAGNKIMIKKK